MIIGNVFVLFDEKHFPCLYAFGSIRFKTIPPHEGVVLIAFAYNHSLKGARSSF